MDFRNLKQFMDNMAAERTPGNAVQLWLDGKKVFEYAAGYSDLENKIQLRGDELFNIYSCSKLATVTAGMQLLEKGAFLLSDPLYEFIPEFRHMYVKNPDGSIRKAEIPITMEHLFTMTAGFSYDLNTPGFQRAREVTQGRMDTVETFRCVAADPIAFEPGTHWNYSICHDVLAAAISVISGKKFREYMKDNIFDPLGMENTVYHHTQETLERTAQQYAFVSAGAETFDLVEAQKFGNSKEGYFKKIGKNVDMILGEEYDSGGAGIITTMDDYAQFLNALANGGTGSNGERILSPNAVRLMGTNRLSPELLKDFRWKQLAGCGYGLGVRTHLYPEKSGLLCSKYEFGWGGAAGASAIVDPEIKLAVFYTQHCLNPREEYYQPRLRNVVYSCL